MWTKRNTMRRSCATGRPNADKPIQVLLDPPGGGDGSVRPGSRVLVLEHRDEVYRGLKLVLEEGGFQVERGRVGATARARIQQFEPDLILVNEELPDESGWLMTCKLRLSHRVQPVWLYAVRKPRWRADWRELLGVDEVIEYRGALTVLVQQIRRRLANRHVSPPVEPARRPAAVAPPAAAG